MLEKIIFVRHPQTIWNDAKNPEDIDCKKRLLGHVDIPLSALGKKHAGLIAGFVKTQKPDKIYSSPLLRAEETARLISKSTHADIVFAESLKEIDFGDCEGLTFEELRKKYPETFRYYLNHSAKIAFPEGETFFGFKKRVNACMRDIIANGNKTTIIVTHGGVIRIALCGLLGIADKFFWNIKQDYGAINVLSSAGNAFTIEKINYVVQARK